MDLASPRRRAAARRGRRGHRTRTMVVGGTMMWRRDHGRNEGGRIMHRTLLLMILVLPAAITVPSSAVVAQGSPPAGSPPSSATPQTVEAMLASCPYPQAVEIPGAKGIFVPWGLGTSQSRVWLAGFGRPPAKYLRTAASPVPTPSRPGHTNHTSRDTAGASKPYGLLAPAFPRPSPCAVRM